MYMFYENVVVLFHTNAFFRMRSLFHILNKNNACYVIIFTKYFNLFIYKLIYNQFFSKIIINLIILLFNNALFIRLLRHILKVDKINK